MANSALELLGLILTVIGLIGVAASTGMPMWRVTAFIGENIIVFETRYEGLWMNCFKQADIRMQCKVYDSLLALPPDLQAARGLMCCSLALAGLGLLTSLAGLQCTSCIRSNDRAKRLVLIVGGALILAACVCVLIPVSWTGHVIIRDFYNPLLLDAQRRELGEALYIGWVSGAFLFAGGCVFTCCNLQSDGKDPRGYVYSGNSDYAVYPPQPVRPLQPQQLVLIPQAQTRAQIQPVLSRHPSSDYSYQSRQPSRQPSGYPSRYPSERSGVAYL